MKVSKEFVKIQNAQYYAGIKSYIKTYKSNDINLYIAIVRLIEGKPLLIEDILENDNLEKNNG